MRFEPAGHKAVLFVFDEPGAWTRYRCEHQGEQLEFLGVTHDIAQSNAVDLAAAVDHYESFVLNRVEWSDEVAVFLERASRRGRCVIFDTDDLIFDPSLDHHFAFLDGWPEEERQKEIARFRRYQRTLRSCNGATVTTEPLRAHAEQHVKPVEVVFNAVSEEMIRLADDALAGPRPPRGRARTETTIAYFSGTRTHNRDFLQAADAVLWALATYPETRFLAVGKLELDDRFDRFGPRVARMPMQPWGALPELLARVDVNLAPLEQANPFTECKSCVKYLEAALLCVPTIASPRPDFVRAVDDGQNGLLAETPQEWQDALGRLIESPQLRDEIGGAGRDDVRSHHTTQARAPLLGRALAALTGGSDAAREPRTSRG